MVWFCQDVPKCPCDLETEVGRCVIVPRLVQALKEKIDRFLGLFAACRQHIGGQASDQHVVTIPLTRTRQSDPGLWVDLEG
jgi:hypothetical protein